jgi:hypothetical protein
VLGRLQVGRGSPARVLVVDLDDLFARSLVAGLRLGCRFSFARLWLVAMHNPTVHRNVKSGSLDSDLHITAREIDLHVSGIQPNAVLGSRGHDRTFEHKLREMLAPPASHANDDPSTAAPHTVARGLEANRPELSDLLRDRRRRHHRGAARRLGRRRRLSWCGFAEPGLLQGKPQQFGALLLFEEGRRDAACVTRASYAVRTVRRCFDAGIGAGRKCLPAQRGHRAAFRYAGGEVNPPTALASDRLEPNPGDAHRPDDARAVTRSPR